MTIEPHGLENQASFDSHAFPLTGKRLIEASAGTGKTYSIANLFLRLVLGHGVQQALSVDQILVVTFTRAATAELSGRIRARLEQAFRDFRAGKSKDDFIAELIGDFVSDESKLSAIKRLNAAILSMDEASISTIHSFAVRAIQAFVFETGALAEVEISEGSNIKTEVLIDDLYRQLVNLKDDDLKLYFDAINLGKRSEFSSYFSKFNKQAKYSPQLGFDLTDDPLTTHIQQIKQLVDGRIQLVMDEREKLKSTWDKLVADTGEVQLKTDLSLLLDIEVNGEKPRSKFGGTMFNYVDKTVNSTSSQPTRFHINGTKTSIQWNALITQGSTDPLYRYIRSVTDHIDACPANMKAQYMKSFLAQWLGFQSGNIDLSSLQLDEVIELINARLDEEEAGQKLRQIITGTYPVCLVDEFQDTDPEQFRMFNQIYTQAEEGTGFFMIGDPKQSIYAFRGADIFSYLKVREKVKAEEEASSGSGQADQMIFSLDTNWRSKEALVNSTNALFRETSPPRAPVFLDDRIDYQPVKSCEAGTSINKGDYYFGKDSQLSNESLVFIGNPHSDVDQLTKGSLQRKFARDTAARISALLHAKTGGRVKNTGGEERSISPGEIAILVRSGIEARVLREELARPEIGLRSVYMSQKDSVFSGAEISEDIYFILVAIHEYSDKRRLKAALATPLLRGFESFINSKAVMKRWKHSLRSSPTTKAYGRRMAFSPR